MINPYDFEPTDDRVMIETIPEAKMSEGGIALPETLKQDNMDVMFAKVLKVGPPGKEISGGQPVELPRVPLCAGDVVTVKPTMMLWVLRKNAGGTGRHLAIISRAEVLGVIKCKTQE